MKKTLIFILCLLALISLPLSVIAHSGRTDSNGGHTNHSTGEYHYHHGHPAHQHEDGYCPYDEDIQPGCEDTFNIVLVFILVWFVVTIGIAKLDIGYAIISKFNPDVHRNATGPFIIDAIISFIATLLIFGLFSQF